MNIAKNKPLIATVHDLPEIFELCRQHKQRRLVLLAYRGLEDNAAADLYIQNWNLRKDEIYTIADSYSINDLSCLTEIPSLQHFGLSCFDIGYVGALAIAGKLPNLHTLDLSGNSIGRAGALAIADKLPKLHTLDLSGNDIGNGGARAIAEKLQNLHTLNLSSNNVGNAGAQAIAEKLHNLHTLNLSGNNVGNAGARAIAGKLPNLHTLLLSSANVGDVGTQAIAENLYNLHTLSLSDNNVGEAGARAIANKQSNIQNLYLNNNNVNDSGACAIAEKLYNLEVFFLGRNDLGDTGAMAIADKLKKLCALDLQYNNISDNSVKTIVGLLPDLKYISLIGNHRLTLPKELLGYSTPASTLRHYLRRIASEGQRKLNEAKLIVVGNESVGKTALVNILIKNEPCGDTDKTPGLYIEERIEVSEWETVSGGEAGDPLRLNVWDFGGQEITRETHKLFLTARSLYLVVLEARRENASDAENVLHDWMRAIRHRGGEAVPVIVVINKSEGDRELRLDETTLSKTYPIRAFIRTCCRDSAKFKDGGKGIKELRDKIVKTIRNEIPQASAEFPVSYFDVKEKLRTVSQAEHSFGIARFINICNTVKNPINSEEEQGRLLQLLVDIGVIIQHRETTLLDPNWLTTAIYRVLTHSDVVKKAGLFRVQDLGRLLAAVQSTGKEPQSGGQYPKERWQYIVDQTVHCGLSFEIADEPGTYLMPEQLPPNAIETGLDLSESREVLRFRYDYADIPKGLIPRFIVQMHRYLTKSRTCWANGVVLYIGDCKVLVKSDRRTRRVNIYVHGPHNERREVLRVVREGLERVHELFEEIEANAMVPVSIPNKLDSAVPYSVLIDHERTGAAFEKILHEGVVFDVRELLGAIAPLPDRTLSVEKTTNVEIHAGKGARIQVNTGIQSQTPVDQSQTKPLLNAPGKASLLSTMQLWFVPMIAGLVTMSILGMWIGGVDSKWMIFLGFPTMIVAIVYIAVSYFMAAKYNWARRNAGICIAVASACMLSPGLKFLVDFAPKSKVEVILDNAVWPAPMAFLAACYFSWIQWKKDELHAKN